MKVAKRRSKGDGSIKHRPDGRWEARLTLPNGRRKSIYGKTQKEVRAKLKEAQNKVEAGGDLAADVVSVGKYLAGWLEDVKSSIAPSTHASYASYLRTHLVPSLGSIKLSQLKATHVNSMMRGMAEKGRSPRTQNLARATLRKALNDAIDADLLTSNAAAKARPAKQESKQVSPLSPVQVRVLLDSIRDHRHGPIIHAAIGTGMRQGELLGLRWEDVDLDNAVLSVKHSMQRVDGKPTFAPTKTDKSRRSIAIDPSTLDALRRQQQIVEELKDLAGSKWTDWNLVFPSNVGTPLNNSNVTHQFQKLVEKVGLPRQRFHDLRHCTASLIASQGGDLKAIQEALGHAQIALTANTYTHFYDDMRRDTANRIGAAISGSIEVKGSD